MNRVPFQNKTTSLRIDRWSLPWHMRIIPHDSRTHLMKKIKTCLCLEVPCPTSTLGKKHS